MKIPSYFRRQLKDDLVIVWEISRWKSSKISRNDYKYAESDIMHSFFPIYWRTNKSMAFVRLGQRSMRHPPVGCPLRFFTIKRLIEIPPDLLKTFREVPSSLFRWYSLAAELANGIKSRDKMDKNRLLFFYSREVNEAIDVIRIGHAYRTLDKSLY